MELELKQIVPYLPYGLKILNGWGDIKTLRYSHLDDEGSGVIHHVKPILRPLSDLISYNANGFSISNMITHGYHNDFWGEEKFSVKHVYYYDLIMLLENHFDVFNLIPAGLAIDINTLT